MSQATLASVSTKLLRCLLGALVIVLWVGRAAAAPPSVVLHGGDGAAAPADPILVVMLDAVGYEQVRAAIEESRSAGRPLFESMHEPVPVISSFPSTTTVSLAGSFQPLGMQQPPGYEARFYDWEQEKVRGGGLISYNRIDTYWADFFHWHVENPLRKGFGFLRPLKFARFEIRRGLEEFLHSQQPVFLTYVSATDGAAHLKGPDALAPLLETLDRELQEARKRRSFTTVLFSDHGIQGAALESAAATPSRSAKQPAKSPPLRNLRRAMNRALGVAGFSLRGRIEGARDVVAVRYGLLDSAVFFTDPAASREVAQVLAGVPGVDLCAAVESETSWSVYTSTQQARIEASASLARRPLEDLSLRVVGDAQVFADPVPTDRWLPADEWLEITAEHRTPDAPYRIARGFELVANPASVLCSIGDGYMVGSGFTDWSGRLTVGRLRWTHGSLRAEASRGFLMTDALQWDESIEVLRFDDALLEVLPRGWQRDGPASESSPEE